MNKSFFRFSLEILDRKSVVINFAWLKSLSLSTENWLKVKGMYKRIGGGRG
jgi:hypothetical protein